MLDRIEFLLGMRVRGKPAILGAAFLAILALSLLAFLRAGSSHAERVLFFPVDHGRGLAAEERFLPRHRDAERDLRELVEGVILGPMRHDAARVFPRGASVRSVLVSGRTLYLDLSPQVLGDDPELPLKGKDALDALVKSIRFNFPRMREITIYIDGQLPRFDLARFVEKKKS